MYNNIIIMSIKDHTLELERLTYEKEQKNI